ncbi:major facilitator superfamily domain-containing protein [Umbelopsis sp. PMI_123]|nr:major facilitator superfamily domain-containing protein [Umbelopsis sp. PMI_123]
MISRLNTPLAQIIILGFVAFCSPGMFNSLSGLGAGGRMSSDVALVDSANAALYACFAIVGFFAGSIVNTFGPKYTLMVGTLGYILYSASLWVYDVKENSGFVIAAGAILGCCAGILWTAQGAIMMAYPNEQEKGRFVSIFWTIFNLGGVLGSLIPLGMNLTSGNSGVSTATYTVFVVIMAVGTLLCLLIAPPQKVVRKDGSTVEVHPNLGWKEELKGVVRVLAEWRILALIPAFLASNWFYAYQFGLNAIYFDIKTRSLNGVVYWAAQIVASILLGILLDYNGLPRRTRGLLGLAVTALITMGVWAGGLAFQLTFDRSYDNPISLTSPGFGGPFFLYMMYGFTDALYQSYLYWLMGAMSNDSNTLARYAGFYKAVQSAGGAISFGIDAVHTSLLVELIICWALVAVSLPLIWLVARQVSNTNVEETVEEKKDLEKLDSGKGTIMSKDDASY